MTLTISNIAAHNLRLTERKAEKQDPYVYFKLGRHSVKTMQDKNGGVNSAWAEVLHLETDDTADRTLDVKVYNKNLLKDDLIGAATVSLSALAGGQARLPLQDPHGMPAGEVSFSVSGGGVSAGGHHHGTGMGTTGVAPGTHGHNTGAIGEGLAPGQHGYPGSGGGVAPGTYGHQTGGPTATTGGVGAGADREGVAPGHHGYPGTHGMGTAGVAPGTHGHHTGAGVGPGVGAGVGAAAIGEGVSAGQHGHHGHHTTPGIAHAPGYGTPEGAAYNTPGAASTGAPGNTGYNAGMGPGTGAGYDQPNQSLTDKAKNAVTGTVQSAQRGLQKTEEKVTLSIRLLTVSDYLTTWNLANMHRTADELLSVGTDLQIQPPLRIAQFRVPQHDIHLIHASPRRK